MWNNTLISLPSDGQKVWLRQKWFSFYPAIATFNSATNKFTLDGSSLQIDALNVARWRSYIVPEGLPIGEARVGDNLIVG